MENVIFKKSTNIYEKSNTIFLRTQLFNKIITRTSLYEQLFFSTTTLSIQNMEKNRNKKKKTV